MTKTRSTMVSAQEVLDEADLKVREIDTKEFDKSIAKLKESLNSITALPVFDIFDKAKKWNSDGDIYGNPLNGFGSISNTFDQHLKRGSAGLDIAALMGTEILSVSSGKVVANSYDDRSGNYIIIEAPNGDKIGYMHMKDPSLLKVGSDVVQGNVIGLVGSTGSSTGSHLHLQIKRNGKHIDPAPLISGYASGIDYHPGGLAVVGDEFRGAYEAIVLPDGTVKILGTNGAEFVDLPRGSEVIPHDQTKNLMTALGQKIPKYSNGTGLSEETKKKIDEIINFSQQSQNETDRIVNEGIANQIKIQQSNYNPELEMRLLQQLAINQGRKGAQYAARQYQELRKNFLDYWNSGEYEEEVIDAYYESFDKLEDIIYDFESRVSESRRKILDEEIESLRNVMSDKIDIGISRLQSTSTLLSSHFDVVNAISEEQHNLNKELLEAETIGARMNEQERKSLFTKAEHTKLSSKLNGIMDDISKLQRNYTRDLEDANKDTIEEITNHYERQYELKMKEYEIVKAELALSKAEQILENVENEKSVRTWNGSRWVYTSVLQDVINAQEDIENAKFELEKARIEKTQQAQLNALDANVDALQTEKNKLETVIKEMTKSEKNVVTVLQNIAEADLPTFKAIMEASGRAIQNAFDISDRTINRIVKDATENDILDRMKERSSAWHGASDDEKKNLEDANKADASKLGLEFEPSTGRWKKRNGIYAYSSGSNNTKRGMGLFDEDGFGSEIILTKDGVLTQFNGGERVFSSEMADRLWEMAQQNYSFAPVISQHDFGRLIPIEDKINNAISNISNAFGDTYMIKDVQLTESEGGTLKGFIDFLKKKI